MKIISFRGMQFALVSRLSRCFYLAPAGRTAVSRLADVEGCFGILFSLLFKTDNPTAAVPGLSMEIATKVLEKIDDRAPLRLKL